MKKLTVILLLTLLIPLTANAEEDTKEVLACMAGASADIDGSKSYVSDASEIRFFLTLKRKNSEIYALQVKYTGVMEEMPASWYQCYTDGPGNLHLSLYLCSTNADTIWYYPARKHGVKATVLITSMLEENRANAAGIYNFSCTVF